MDWLKKLLDRLRGPVFGEAIAVPVGYISARVYRAATGEWEDLGVVASVERNPL